MVGSRGVIGAGGGVVVGSGGGVVGSGVVNRAVVVDWGVVAVPLLPGVETQLRYGDGVARHQRVATISGSPTF